jgi:hypothetical protein
LNDELANSTLNLKFDQTMTYSKLYFALHSDNANEKQIGEILEKRCALDDEVYYNLYKIINAHKNFIK